MASPGWGEHSKLGHRSHFSKELGLWRQQVWFPTEALPFLGMPVPTLTLLSPRAEVCKQLPPSSPHGRVHVLRASSSLHPVQAQRNLASLITVGSRKS